MHHYPFHVGDYIRATAHLDIIEDCIYRRLIDLYMETESPIPNETQQVIRRLRLGSSGLILETILQEFFTLESDNCWHNSRCDAEIAEYKRLANVSRINGMKGGRPKKTQLVSSGLSKKTQQDTTNNQEPITSNKEKPTSAKSAISIKTFLANCEASGERRIPETDSVFEFAETTGISMDMVKVCWNHFVEMHLQSGKRQKDWRGTFRNCVKSNWYKLWFIEADGTVKETSQYRALKKGQKDV